MDDYSCSCSCQGVRAVAERSRPGLGLSSSQRLEVRRVPSAMILRSSAPRTGPKVDGTDAAAVGGVTNAADAVVDGGDDVAVAAHEHWKKCFLCEEQAQPGAGEVRESQPSIPWRTSSTEEACKKKTSIRIGEGEVAMAAGGGMKAAGVVGDGSAGGSRMACRRKRWPMSER